MKFKVGQYEYLFTSANQTITEGGCQFTITLADGTLDIETLDANIRANLDDGFYLDTTKYEGYSLTNIQKQIFDDQTVITVHLFKARVIND